MNTPPSATKIRKKNGNIEIEYLNNVDRAKYCLQGLIYMALKDTGKYVMKNFRNEFYRVFKKHSGKAGRYAGFWARRDQLDLQVGIKPKGFYAGFEETGTIKQRRLGILEDSVKDHIEEIRKIQAQYLSALEDENKAVSMIDGSDEAQGDNDE